MMKTAEKAGFSMFCYSSIGKLGVHLIRRCLMSLKCKVELTSTTKFFELAKLKSIASRAKFTKFLYFAKINASQNLATFPENYQTEPAEIWHTYNRTVMLLVYENGTEPRPPSLGLLAPEVT